MKGFVVQDWLTIRGASGAVSPIAQSQPFWLDLSDYRDVIAWLEVAEFTIDAGVSLLLNYQTSPFEDEQLFNSMSGPLTIANGVTVTQMLADRSPPLARYFRGKLEPSAVTAAAWDITFRILIAVNRPGYRTPSYAGPSASNGPIVMALPKKSGGSSGGGGYKQLPINLPKYK